MRILAHLIDSLFKYPALGLILLYRYTLSYFFGRTCRHEPSCSLYTYEAIKSFGFWRGGWVGAARLSRCRPNGTNGYDPVPELLPEKAVWYKPWLYGKWK